MIVGIISDTHGLMRPQALAALAGSDRILHAGDVGAPDVLDALAAIAPVVAVRGNNDEGRWAKRLPARAVVDAGGLRICLVHELATLRLEPGIAAVVSGHSHRPIAEDRDGVLYLNPGSAGPRRFTLPVTVARLRIEKRRLSSEIIELVV